MSALALAVASALGVWLPASAGADVPVSCSLYASPSGSDLAGTGSPASPFRSAQHLVNSLRPGQTGCLEAGTYSQSPGLAFPHAGDPGAPITLSSAPGQSATLAGGYVYMPSGSNYVTVENLHINTHGTRQVGVQVMASNVSLIADDITNAHERTTCIILGSNSGWGQAVEALIKGNVIHQCGNSADGNQDHAIYFDNSVDATVADNVIWGTSAFAIHLYENAQGNQITHNVIDSGGYGVIFAGSASLDSNDNRVAYNVITNSAVGYGAESWWGGTVGSGNLFVDNCLYHNAAGNIENQATGFRSSGNIFANPGYRNASARLYILKRRSPCLAVVGYDTAARLRVSREHRLRRRDRDLRLGRGGPKSQTSSRPR